MYNVRCISFVLIIIICAYGVGISNAAAAAKPPLTYRCRIVNSYPHDQRAFTQGLAFEGGVLYEGTGLKGASGLRQVELTSGKIIKISKLPDEFFGEGITIYKDKVIQLTWQSRIGFIYDKHSFKLIGKFSYPFEGWGITSDGRYLIASDGTDALHFLNPRTFKEEAVIKVFDNNGSVASLNELEFINGEIYANIWQKDIIVRISPETGEVLGWIDLRGLLSEYGYASPAGVLNGIAYDKDNNRLFITGKLWPKIFEVELIANNY